MDHTEAIKRIMKKSGLKQSDIAEKLGLNSPSTISMRMHRKTAYFSKILELLDALDYEMVAMPKKCPPLPEDAYALSKEDYQ